MNPDDAFERILALLHEAALDGAAWPAAAALIDEACGTVGNALVVAGRSGDIYAIQPLYRGEADYDAAREYFEVYYPHDEILRRRMEMPDGRLVRSAELYAEAASRTPVADNVLEGWRLMRAQNGFSASVEQPGGLRIFWGVGDPVGDDWESAQVALLERLLPHVVRTVVIRQALVEAEALGAGLAGLLDNDRIGAVQLDREGRVLEANKPALEILRRGDGLIDRDGALDAWLPADRSRLKRLLGRALPDLYGEAPSSGSMTIQRSSGRSRLALHVSPVGGAEADFGGAPGGGAGARGRPGAPRPHRRPAGFGDARPDAVEGPDGGAAGRGPEGGRDRRRERLVGGLRPLAGQAGLPQAGHLGAGRTGAPGPGGGRLAPALKARRGRG